MLDRLFRPLRSVLGAGEEASKLPRDLDDVVHAMHRISESIERQTDMTDESIKRQLDMIDELATSVGPLKDSVNQLTATMHDLVSLMAPIGEAEQGVRGAERGIKHGLERAETFVGIRHETEVDEHSGAGQTSPKPPS